MKSNKNSFSWTIATLWENVFYEIPSQSGPISEVYSKHCQTSKMERFAESR